MNETTGSTTGNHQHSPAHWRDRNPYYYTLLVTATLLATHLVFMQTHLLTTLDPDRWRIGLGEGMHFVSVQGIVLFLIPRHVQRWPVALLAVVVAFTAFFGQVLSASLLAAPLTLRWWGECMLWVGFALAFLWFMLWLERKWEISSPTTDTPAEINTTR